MMPSWPPDDLLLFFLRISSISFGLIMTSSVASSSVKFGSSECFCNVISLLTVSSHSLLRYQSGVCGFVRVWWHEFRPVLTFRLHCSVNTCILLVKYVTPSSMLSLSAIISG